MLPRVYLHLPLALASLSLLFCNGCATPPPLPSKPKPESKTNDSAVRAQHAFFPDGFPSKVGSFILSLPIGYYESAYDRLRFAQQILETGSPKPVARQEYYLQVPADGLAPDRHFLLLDQRHLLIYSEAITLEDGYPPELEVLQRTGDASWSKVTPKAVPEWARNPQAVKFVKVQAPATLKVTGKNGSPRELHWVEEKGSLTTRNSQ